MKLTDRFKKILEPQYSKTFVMDEKGDGHFIQIICVDDSFTKKNKLARSREILKALSEAQSMCHAISVKGFTSLEWDAVEADFEWIKYTHQP